MPARRKVSKTCRVFIGRHIRIHRREGMPRDQAVAVAYAEARERGCKVPPAPRRRKDEDKWGYRHTGQSHETACCMCGASGASGHCCCQCPKA